MKLYTAAEVKKSGRFIGLYGKTAVGKTTSALQSLTTPILFSFFEPRSQYEQIDASGRDPGKDIMVAEYENWQDLIAFYANPKNVEPYASLLIDGTSYLMNIGLSQEIEDENFEALPENDRDIKSLTKQSKLSQEGWGTLASQMFRLMDSLGKYSWSGKTVCMTMLEQENPKWGRDQGLCIAPAFKGKEFSSNFVGYLDLLGYVRERQDANGVIKYPPMVHFQDPGNEGFLCKYTGPNLSKPAVGPLNINGFLAMLETQRTKEKNA